MEKKAHFVRYDTCKKMDEIVQKSMCPMIIFDTETTGLTKNDYIVQISAIKLEKKNGLYQITRKLNEYIKPPIPMPKEASDVNHITDEMLANKPTEEDIISKIKDFFGDVDSSIIAGYNVGYDIKMLNAMYERTCGESFSPPTVIDAFAMAKELVEKEDLPGKSRNLTAVAGLYGIEEDSMHSSDTDTLVTGKVMWEMLNDYRANFKKGQEPEAYAEKPVITITGMFPFQKSKYVNYIMINVSMTDNGEYKTGRFHYDLYDGRYVEDTGGIMEKGNMLRFSYDADKAAGGDIKKFKSKEGK